MTVVARGGDCVRRANGLIARGCAIRSLPFVGGGNHAVVFALSRDRVLKITSDAVDAYQFELARLAREAGRDLPGLPEVFGVWSVALAEPDSEQSRREWREGCYALELSRGHPLPPELRGCEWRRMGERLPSAGPLASFLREAREVVAGLLAEGIRPIDTFGPEQWGVDGDWRPLLFDLGAGSLDGPGRTRRLPSGERHFVSVAEFLGREPPELPTIDAAALGGTLDPYPVPRR